MTTDITELAAVLRLAAESEIACRAEGDTSDLWQEEASPANVIALVEALEKAQTINAAAEKLVRCKGRYHSEQNYRALAALFGVTSPDLPPLDSESRTVTVKLPPKIERNDIDGWFTYKGGRVGGGAAEWYNKALDDVGSELTDSGIKWEAE
ncbi:TPA: hypothetical protein RFF92_001606 [Klebsiella aerogenes]|nr:hypothetical protein [Klebsiella aerogenes]